jgi:murein L,D-transpeptidase YafK
LIRRPVTSRWRSILVAAAASVALTGCNVEHLDPVTLNKALQPLSGEMVGLLEQKGMTKEAPILLRSYKEESELEVWKQDANGIYALLKTYPICRWSGELGPKVKQGDRQAPEGFYTITPGAMNPNSQYYLSFNLGYPNAFDRSHGRTGTHLMVHGNCSSAGCYSMTDEQIGEIYALGRESFFGGQKTFQVQAYPFRMTALNMAKHRNSPHLAFWKMLKEGNDHFEVTGAEPKVEVCEKRYVFNAGAPANMSRALAFDPAGKCPVYQVPTEVANAVADKTRRDEAAFAQYVNRGTATVPVVTGRDGGMHPVFQAKLNPQTITDGKGNVRWVVENPPPGMKVAVAAPARDPANEFTPAIAAAAPITTASTSATGTPATAYADVPMPRPAPRGGSALASRSSGGDAGETTSGSMFSSLFTSGARALGFGHEEKPAPRPAPVAIAPARPAPASAPVPQPAPKQTAVAATEPRRDPPKAETQLAAAKSEAPKPEAQKPEPPRQTAEALPPKTFSNNGSLLTGAQPVVPTGSFESRWPAAFR